MYNAAVIEKVNIEDPKVIVSHARNVLDADKLLGVIQSGVLADAVLAANDYAYEQSEVWVVPAFRMDGRKLDSISGVGVTKEQLDAFMGVRY
jgi:predicted DsbA family dithiol-disulfide isomerase